MEIINLHSADDIISVMDRLEWIDARRVLFILPPDTAVLRGLDLIRLRRYADRQRREIGLVTADGKLARQARALGLPAFSSVAQAETSRRGWWRGRRRAERVGLPTFGAPLDDGAPVPADLPTSPTSPPSPEKVRRLWLVRYTVVFLFFVAAALFVVGFMYVVPRATVVLKPERRSLQITQTVLADPALSRIDYRQTAVPARLLTVTSSWQADVQTTGVVALPATPARGRVRFTNLTAEPVTIPAGMPLTASEGAAEFQTVAEVTVPGVEGGTAEIEVIAQEPGPAGNVPAGAVTGMPPALNDLVEARNPEPMDGGGVREVPAVSEADVSLLRSQTLQFLQALALSEMEADLTEREFLARESLRVVEIVSEEYSHPVGAQTDRLALTLSAVVQGTAVNTTIASGLVYEGLASQTPAGFTLVPESITFAPGEVLSADEAGRISFQMTGDGMVVRELTLAESLATVAGQDAELAAAYLYSSLPLREPPAIETWPLWMQRLPFRPARIETVIE